MVKNKTRERLVREKISAQQLRFASHVYSVEWWVRDFAALPSVVFLEQEGRNSWRNEHK